MVGRNNGTQTMQAAVSEARGEGSGGVHRVGLAVIEKGSKDSFVREEGRGRVKLKKM